MILVLLASLTLAAPVLPHRIPRMFQPVPALSAIAPCDSFFGLLKTPGSPDTLYVCVMRADSTVWLVRRPGYEDFLRGDWKRTWKRIVKEGDKPCSR